MTGVAGRCGQTRVRPRIVSANPPARRGGTLTAADIHLTILGVLHRGRLKLRRLAWLVQLDTPRTKPLGPSARIHRQCTRSLRNRERHNRRHHQDQLVPLRHHLRPGRQTAPLFVGRTSRLSIQRKARQCRRLLAPLRHLRTRQMDHPPCAALGTSRHRVIVAPNPREGESMRAKRASLPEHRHNHVPCLRRSSTPVGKTKNFGSLDQRRRSEHA